MVGEIGNIPAKHFHESSRKKPLACRMRMRMVRERTIRVQALGEPGFGDLFAFSHLVPGAIGEMFQPRDETSSEMAVSFVNGKYDKDISVRERQRLNPKDWRRAKIGSLSEGNFVFLKSL